MIDIWYRLATPEQIETLTYRALDSELSEAVLRIARELFPQGFDVSDGLGEMTFDILCETLDRTGRMVVWSGGSDATIWGAPEVNHAFRAWHDWHHWQARLPFTPEGEHATCLLQIQDLLARYGDNEKTRRWARILHAEIVGQLEYAAHHSGAFPTDQYAFAVHYLCCASAAIRCDF